MFNGDGGGGGDSGRRCRDGPVGGCTVVEVEAGVASDCCVHAHDQFDRLNNGTVYYFERLAPVWHVRKLAQ